MSTSLSVYERITDPMAAVKSLGESIAKSGLFKCENIAQGEVFAMECLARRQPPLSLKEEYHVIPTIGVVRKYDFMLARFNAMGGKHRIIERTDVAAEIELEWDGQKIRERLTWDEAKGEKWPYGKTDSKGNKQLKDNWSTPRSRRQMLWARVVTEGLRALCPQSTGGYYAPEEFGEIIEEEGGSNGNGHAAEDVPFTVEPAKPVPAASTTPAPAAASAPASQPAATTTNPPPITKQQLARINELYVQLDIPMEKREAALKRRGVGSLLGLSMDQAGEILSKLEVLATEAATQVTGESAADPAAVSALNTEPCSAVQIERVKTLIGEAEQVEPGTTGKIKSWLTKHGLNLIRDLCISDCDRLIAHLERRQLEGFFDRDLTKAAAKEDPSKN